MNNREDDKRGITMNDDSQPKKMHPEKARQNFYLLALDWVHLHIWLPSPPLGENERRAKVREYGHPAQWASDKAAQITDLLSSWHDMLAEHRRERPPQKGAEEVRVVAAWQYLEPRFEQLVELVSAEDLSEVADLHRQVQTTLGLSHRRDIIPIPCPNDADCESAFTLERVVGVGHDYIACGLCNYTVREMHYSLLVRMTLDSLIDGAVADRMGDLSREALGLIAGRDSTTVSQVVSRLNNVRKSKSGPPIDNGRAGVLLSRLVDRGLICRTGRGVYAPMPEDDKTRNAA